MAVRTLMFLMLASMCAALRAHHAFDTEFDRRMPLTLQGVVTRIEWRNPHAWLHLEVREPDGRVARWRVQTAPPGVLASFGWRKDSLPTGTFIVVDGFRAKTREALLHGHDIVLADGTRMCANVPCRCCRPFGQPAPTK